MKTEELQELSQLTSQLMPTLLSTASSRPDAWSVQALTKASPSMEMAYLKFEDGAAILQLIAKSDLGDVCTPWTPNVYRGDGSEARVTMTVNIPDHLREDIEALEEIVRNKLRTHVPNIDARWHSASKPSDKHPSSLRLKFTISGQKACPCYNSDGEPVPMPSAWAGLSVIPIVHVKGVYIQKGMAGLVMEVVSLLVGDRKRHDVGMTFV